MDSLIFMPDSVKAANVEETVASSAVPQAHDKKQGRETAEKEVESEIEVENVERPVDLYKVRSICVYIIDVTSIPPLGLG